MVVEQVPSKERRWVPSADARRPTTGAATFLEETAIHAEPGRFVELHVSRPEESTPLGDAFETLQAFDGTVERISGDDVFVVLHDLTDPNNADEDAVLSVRQFDDPDRVAVGAPFYLMIGYRERRSGRELVTVARVRTIVPLTAAQRARAEREGKALFGLIGQLGGG